MNFARVLSLQALYLQFELFTSEQIYFNFDDFLCIVRTKRTPLIIKVNHIIIPQRANCLGKTLKPPRVEKGERVWTGLYWTESVINEVWKYNVWLRHCAYINIHSDTYQCISVSSIIYLVTTGGGDINNSFWCSKLWNNTLHSGLLGHFH